MALGLAGMEIEKAALTIYSTTLFINIHKKETTLILYSHFLQVYQDLFDYNHLTRRT